MLFFGNSLRLWDGSFNTAGKKNSRNQLREEKSILVRKRRGKRVGKKGPKKVKKKKGRKKAKK